MINKLLLGALLLSTSAFSSAPHPAEKPTSLLANQCVILLHGLARSASSMEKLALKLEAAGYQVANIDYPSRHHSIPVLADMAIREGLDKCQQKSTQSVNFVTHSLGGILVREYLSRHEIPSLHRVVMLGPPNQGSEIVDKLRDTPGFAAFNGPAGLQLGTGQTDIPAQLGAVDFELGVIAGTASINLILSHYLPGIDDGKVTVKNTKVVGMQDFIALPVSHPVLMKSDRVIEHTLYFLKHGKFKHLLQ